MNENALLSNASIVFLGHFNPIIMHPQWFNRYKILPIQETQKAEGEKPNVIEIPYEGRKVAIEEPSLTSVTAGYTFISFPSLTIEVALDRYVCSATKSENFNLIKEVTIKTFNILEHTPIKSVGTNFDGHWKCKSGAQDKLKSLFAKDDGSFKSIFGDEYHIGGAISFQRNGRRITLRINKSNFLDDGVHFSFNFHKSGLETQQAKEAVDVINDNYDKDIDESISIAKELIGTPENTWKPKS